MPPEQSISPEFTNLQLWNMDYHLAEYIAKGLRAFAKYQAGFPGELTEDEWHRVLDEMAEGFEAYARDDTRDTAPLNRSLDLLRDYFPALWW